MNTRTVAQRLGWHVSERTQIVSRYPIVDPPGANGLYVFVEPHLRCDAGPDAAPRGGRFAEPRAGRHTERALARRRPRRRGRRPRARVVHRRLEVDRRSCRRTLSFATATLAAGAYEAVLLDPRGRVVARSPFWLYDRGAVTTVSTSKAVYAVGEPIGVS